MLLILDRLLSNRRRNRQWLCDLRGPAENSGMSELQKTDVPVNGGDAGVEAGWAALEPGEGATGSGQDGGDGGRRVAARKSKKVNDGGGGGREGEGGEIPG